MSEQNAQMSKKMLNAVCVLKLYTQDYKAGLHGRAISKKIKEKQRSTADKLNTLAKHKILTYEAKGNAKDYYLNLKNPVVFDLMVVAEQYKSIMFLENTFMFRDLFFKLRRIVDGYIIIFGSYARGDYSKQSDLDVLIIGKYNQKNMDNILSQYPIKVNTMPMKKKAFKNGLFKKHNFILEVLKYHIIMKGTSDIVDLFWRFYNG